MMHVFVRDDDLIKVFVLMYSIIYATVTMISVCLVTDSFRSKSMYDGTFS